MDILTFLEKMGDNVLHRETPHREVVDELQKLTDILTFLEKVGDKYYHRETPHREVADELLRTISWGQLERRSPAGPERPEGFAETRLQKSTLKPRSLFLFNAPRSKHFPPEAPVAF